MKEFLPAGRPLYDFIIIDCSLPSLGLITVNASRPPAWSSFGAGEHSLPEGSVSEKNEKSMKALHR
jgi:hypothetical protein